MTTVLGNALAFAKRGFAVVPLHWPVQRDGRRVCSCKKPRDCPSPGKHPYGALAPNGLLSASADTGIIKGWFAYKVPDANYGVVTSGVLFALDIDPRHAGDESLAALEREHGPLPPTWRTISGSGGEHILFNAEGLTLKRGRASDVGLPTGIDAPNYIVGPGSLHICGRRYEWNVDCHPAETKLAVPPPWLIERLTEHPRVKGSATAEPLPKPAEDWLKLTREPVTEYRDMACASFCGYLVCHLDPVVAYDILFWWNDRVVQPPLDDAEVLHIWRRIVHRHAERIREQEATNA